MTFFKSTMNWFLLSLVAFLVVNCKHTSSRSESEGAKEKPDSGMQVAVGSRANPDSENSNSNSNPSPTATQSQNPESSERSVGTVDVSENDQNVGMDNEVDSFRGNSEIYDGKGNNCNFDKFPIKEITAEECTTTQKKVGGGWGGVKIQTSTTCERTITIERKQHLLHKIHTLYGDARFLICSKRSDCVICRVWDPENVKGQKPSTCKADAKKENAHEADKEVICEDVHKAH